MSAITAGGVLSASRGPRPEGSRLAWLDALRGLAALAVVFDHGSTLVVTSAHSFMYQWFNFGQYGVFVFFLVSGSLFPPHWSRRGSAGGFWSGRGSGLTRRTRWRISRARPRSRPATGPWPG